jgi:hypothetical protein
MPMIMCATPTLPFLSVSQMPGPLHNLEVRRLRLAKGGSGVQGRDSFRKYYQELKIGSVANEMDDLANI